MPDTFRHMLEKGVLEASAPCRIDLGGTLDISTFYFPLRRFQPCTVNIAVNLRTHVRLLPHRPGRIRISSRGFKSAEYSLKNAPMAHPLGLLFAVAAYFGEDGVHVRVTSESPPRSGLGGSSAAAVALIGAYMKGITPEKSRPGDVARLAHALEASVAGVPCGIQDQLAAVYGGIHCWHWLGDGGNVSFRKRTLVRAKDHKKIEKRLLLAYCGMPHESKQVNQQWVDQFVSGRSRQRWIEIIQCAKAFADALAAGQIEHAVKWMNRETTIRKKMTPEVLDSAGKQLVTAAIRSGCGARFTGAGGGGCIWALGKEENIDRLRDRWLTIISNHPGASLLHAGVDSRGLRWDASC